MGASTGLVMWDERYRTDEYVYGTHPNDFVVQTADLLPLGRLLSLGEGEGRNAVFLAGLGHEVVAVDSSAVGLEKVRRLADRHGVEVRTVHSDLADFEIGRELVRDIAEGIYHNGRSAVVQALAVRPG